MRNECVLSASDVWKGTPALPFLPGLFTSAQVTGTPVFGTELATVWALSTCFYRDQMNEPMSAEDLPLDIVNQLLSMSQ